MERHGRGTGLNRAGAFFLAPIPAALLGGTVSWTSGGFPRPLSIILFYLLLLYAAQLLFGLAIRAFLLRAGKATALDFTLGGTAMIGLPAVPYMLWAVGQHPHQHATAPVLLALWLLCGAITGLTFWFLTRPGTADPSEP